MTNITTNSSGIILASKVSSNPVSIAAGVLISGSNVGLLGQSEAWTVTNNGRIVGTSDGVDLQFGGSFTDTSTGTVSGATGLIVGGPSTIKVAGTIVGTNGPAVSFGASNGSNLLAVYSGAVFSGIVAGSSTGTNTLEFVSSAGVGTVSGLGTNFTGFGNTTIDSGARWVVAGSNAVPEFQEFLTDSGTMTNTGTLTGEVTLDGGGVLTNASGGVIGNTTFAVIGSAAGIGVLNSGSISAESYAINLVAGGTVTNTANGAILGIEGVTAEGALTLENSGTVAGSGLNGVNVNSDAVITNAAAGVIVGYDSGIYISGSATIQNLGTVVGSNDDGIMLKSAGGVTNSGTILGAAIGVYLSAVSGGSITNALGGTIAGNIDGIEIRTKSGSVVNQGTIFGTITDGIYLSQGGLVTNAGSGVIAGGNGVAARNAIATVVNSGTINGFGTKLDDNGYGVGLSGGGLVINQASGTIAGYIGVGLGTVAGSGTLMNSGTIFGFVGAVGIAHNTIVNAAGGVIAGEVLGVEFVAGDNTVVNAGTIDSFLENSAVSFSGTAANLMVIDPGAVETGIVAASTSGLDTLELASGASTGGVSGLGVDFMNFGTIVVDPAATWSVSGYNTIASGVQVIDTGSLYVSDTLVNSGTISGGISFGGPGGNLANTAGATIAGATAVEYVPNSNQCSVTNAGAIVGTAGYGLRMSGLSTVTNAAGGTISGSNAGIELLSAGYVYNAGSITNSDTAASSPFGVFLSGGGHLTNAVGGHISGETGVKAEGTNATIVAAGTIIGSGGTAVELGGNYSNLLVIDPGAVFTGAVYANVSGTNAIELAAGGSAGTITGLGTSFVNFQTVSVDAGANWTFAGSNSASNTGTIADYGTLTNTGTLNATVTLEAGSTLTNGPDATIATTAAAVTGSQAGVTLANGGVIESSGAYGVEIGQTFAGGLYLQNDNGGSITGTGGVHLLGFGTVNNFGLIGGTATDGVLMGWGGTLRNGGTIVGGNGTAVALIGTGQDDRVVLDPLAVFVGTVVGGISAVSDTMELAAGDGHGTVSGLGVSFVNFGTVTVDSSAYWTLAGYSTIASSNTLLDEGNLTNAGTVAGMVTLDVDGVLTNAAGGTITSITDAVLGTSNSASVVNAGLITGGTIGISLMSGGQVTNQIGGMVEGAGEGGIVSDSQTLAATVVNDGTITGGFYGVTLSGGSTVTNDSSGLISGYGFGVHGDISSVFNAGSIVATGTDGVGVRFDEEFATMTNALSGVVVGQYGVELDAYEATLVNAGTIAGTKGGVYLDGFAANRLVLQPGAVIEGGVLADASAANVLELGTHANTLNSSATGFGAPSGNPGPVTGTVSGLGISFVNFGSITVDAGAHWTAIGVNTVAASVLLTDYGWMSLAGSLTNAGTIIGDNTASSAILVTKTGTLANASTIENTVSLAGGVLINGPAGTVSGGFAVQGGGDYASTVINQGSIGGTSDGVYLGSGGLVTNAAGALIDGGSVGVLIAGSAGTVLNAGTITDSISGGVVTRSGGTVSNAAGALIAGVVGVAATGSIANVTNLGTISGTVHDGVLLGNGGTVSNAGTISGANGTAVAFYGTPANLLVIDPGAVFDGKVTGSASATNRMELAAGASAGTITAIGSSFTDFATVAVDPTATWTFSSTNSIKASGAVDDLGTLINTGTLDAGMGLTVVGNAATAVNVAGATIAGQMVGVVAEGGATLVNHGTVSGGLAFGVGLLSGGVLTNAVGARVFSTGAGVYANGPEAVTNSGSIIAGTDGVRLDGGGTLTNDAQGAISGSTGGVVIAQAAGTVANAGTIAGSGNYGVWLKQGGAITNAAGASIYGYYGGVDIDGDAGAVTNSGTISSESDDGVYLSQGGTVTNAIAGKVVGGGNGVAIEGGAGTVINSGTVTGLTNYGVYIFSGGTNLTAAPGSASGHHVKVGGGSVAVTPTLSAVIINAASATIYGSYNAIYVKDEVATILNEGVIASAPTATGTQSAAYGIFLSSGGTIVNFASALVTGYTGVDIQSSVGEVVNYGTIVGVNNYGVYSDVGSSIINAAGGFIGGAHYGVDLDDGTLINAGTVSGGTGTAVALYGTVANLLVIDPGAVFDGIVAGSPSAANSMELASAVSAGTLVGLGTKYTSFGTVGVDAGADWHLQGSNTLAEGSTLTNAGTLALDPGASLIDAGTLVNNGTVVLATSTSGLLVEALTGTGSVSIAAGSTVGVNGTVSPGETLDFAGGGNAFLILGDGPAASGTIGGFGVGDTIDVTDLAFDAGASTLSVAGNVLTVAEGSATMTFTTAGLADGAPVYAVDDGYGETDITLTPPSPSGMSLALASDSGVTGDALTNVALPTITGTTTPFGTIDLYQGGVLVGTGTADGAGTWSVTTTTPLTEGANSFTSTVTDVAGHVSPASPSLTITLDTATPAAPGTLLLATASDSAVVGDDVTNVSLPTIHGTAIPNGTIDLYDGTTLVGTGTSDNTGAWSVTATTSLAVGANSLTATATDTAGNVSGASPALVVTLETAAVTPTSLSLDAGSDTGVAGDDLTGVALPTIDGTGAAGSTIKLYNDEETLIGTGTVDGTGHWSVGITGALASGANSITATATDVAGNVSGPSVPLVVTLDNVPPSDPTGLTLAPASDSGVQGDDLTNVALPAITGTAEPGSTIDLYNGDVLIGVGTADSSTGFWSVTATTALNAGPNTITATATDAAGNVSGASSALVVSLDTVLPAAPGSLSLAPASDSGVAGDDVTNVSRPAITGTGVTGDLVTLYDGASVIGTATVTAAGTWSVTPVAALANGLHMLNATEADAAGNVSAPTADLSLLIQSGPVAMPTLAETAAVTNPAQPELIGTAEIGATVTIYDGTIALGSAIADSTGQFSFAVPAALSSGTHQLTAVAADIAGDTSLPSATLTVSISANNSYAVIAAPDNAGNTVAHVYNTAGTLSAADTYDTGGLLLQHVGPDSTVRNIYDSAGNLIGTVSGPGAADGVAPQPDFATDRLDKGAQTATDSGASFVNLLAESNNLVTQGNDTVLSGSGTTTVNASSYAVLVAGGSGTLVFAGGSGASTVLGGSGTSSVFGGAGGGIFQGGSAGHNILVAGNGNTTLLGGGVGDLLLGSGSGQQLLVGNAAHQTLVGGGSSATVVGGAAGNNELFGGAGNSKMFAGAGGADTLVAGSGSNIMVAKNGDVVLASLGTSTVFGSATGNDVMVGGGTALMVGGNGNDMYSGGGGLSTIFSGAGNDTVFTGSGTTTAVLGSGADEVFLGSGTATVFAGSGKDIFATFAGQSGGSTTIAGFKVGTDQLGLGGYDLSTVTQQSANGATTLTLTDNTKITLLGINHLSSSSIF